MRLPLPPRALRLRPPTVRNFSTTPPCREILSIHTLPDRVRPQYSKRNDGHLLSLHWDNDPRNIMVIQKPGVPALTDALIEFATYITTAFPGTNLILEQAVAESLHDRLPCPVYTLPSRFPPRLPSPQTEPTSFVSLEAQTNPYHQKTDVLVTLGGDGTILHAASLFSTSRHVPPVLSFSMGTLGFLGEFKWREHRSAFASLRSSCAIEDSPKCDMRVLRRNRLKAGVFGSDGQRVAGEWGEYEGIEDAHAMNELSLHRGRDPHLAILEIFIGPHFLTEAVGDGIIVSTPTGSTAYSLSSGGCILHPSVPSLMLTPICPRSLSFRPLVLPEDAAITLRLSERNRGREVEVGVDGRRWGGLGPGQEVRVWLEKLGEEGEGGIPCVKRLSEPGAEDGWVGGLNGLLKFNYPFGEEE